MEEISLSETQAQARMAGQEAPEQGLVSPARYFVPVTASTA